MEARRAYELATAGAPPSHARFYGAIAGAGIGAGLILQNVQWATYLPDEKRFGVLSSLALVLTHECDLDPGNDRAFNEHAIICPIIPLETLVEDLAVNHSEQEIGELLGNVTARYINRLMYIPLIPDRLPLGGYLYLNQLGHTHLSKLSDDSVEPICMMSADGLRELDYALEKHLRRPKADRMPFERAKN